MQISRKNLKFIITSLLSENKFEIDIGLFPDKKDSPRVSYREVDGKVDAFVEDSQGEVIHKLANASGDEPISVEKPKENEQHILGALRLSLEDAKSQEDKIKITQAISRLLGDDEETLEKNMSVYLGSRHLAAARDAVREKFKFIT
jgi:hypothetical protein